VVSAAGVIEWFLVLPMTRIPCWRFTLLAAVVAWIALSFQSR
jgi:hypothetical protein